MVHWIEFVGRRYVALDNLVEFVVEWFAVEAARSEGGDKVVLEISPYIHGFHHEEQHCNPLVDDERSLHNSRGGSHRTGCLEG